MTDAKLLLLDDSIASILYRVSITTPNHRFVQTISRSHSLKNMRLQILFYLPETIHSAIRLSPSNVRDPEIALKFLQASNDRVRYYANQNSHKTPDANPCWIVVVPWRCYIYVRFYSDIPSECSSSAFEPEARLSDCPAGLKVKPTVTEEKQLLVRIVFSFVLSN